MIRISADRSRFETNLPYLAIESHTYNSFAVYTLHSLDESRSIFFFKLERIALFPFEVVLPGPHKSSFCGIERWQ